MFKQIFNKSDGTPKLIETDYFDTEKYTDIQPPNGLYEPIHFNGSEWVGVSQKEWLANQPKEESTEIPLDEKDELIADLSIQLLEAQEDILSMKEDIANITIQVLGGESNA